MRCECGSREREEQFNESNALAEVRKRINKGTDALTAIGEVEGLLTSFLSVHAGTVAPGARITTRDDPPPANSIGVYVNRKYKDSVALDGPAGDTRERLVEALSKLYVEE